MKLFGITALPAVVTMPLLAFNPATDRGIVILCSSDRRNADITTAGLYKNNNLSYLVWNLLKG